MIISQSRGLKKRSKKKSSKIKSNFPPKKYNLKVVNNNINFSRKKNNKKNISKMNLNLPSRKNNKLRNINNNTKNFKSNKNNRINKTFKPKINANAKTTYNDYELNTFDYRYAVLFDKRTCFQYYLSLIKTKNPILFSFCPRKDYNSMIIRSCIFSLSFSIYYATNFAFFDDNIMHKIYEVGGKYDIILFISQISISFIVSYYITSIIKIIFLSERNINQVRKQYEVSIAYIISDKEKKNLIIKYTIFFILGIIFLFFFWMLLSSFGAVYSNTQMFIFKNTLISFAMSLFYPFLISVFPSTLRTFSLKSNPKDKECLYKVSKFLQVL